MEHSILATPMPSRPDLAWLDGGAGVSFVHSTTLGSQVSHRSRAGPGAAGQLGPLCASLQRPISGMSSSSHRASQELCWGYRGAGRCLSTRSDSVFAWSSSSRMRASPSPETAAPLTCRISSPTPRSPAYSLAVPASTISCT